MATQLLIYERAVPVTSTRHADWSLEVGGDYQFSRSINSAPLMAVEFPSAANEYPIVFAGTAEAVTPAVILGLRAQENLFVDAAGKWPAGYVPAFLTNPIICAGTGSLTPEPASRYMYRIPKFSAAKLYAKA